MVTKKQSISWQAEEYIVPGRNAWWYVGLAIVAIGLSVLSVFLSWWTFLILIILSVITILTSVFRPPRKIDYSLDNKGLAEGSILHKFEDYKAFGILQEGKYYSAVLIPKKRFGLSTKVYFSENNGEQIVDILGAHLPMEEVKLDFLDKIVNFLRI